MKQRESFVFQLEKKCLRQNLLCGQKYELIFSAIYIFQTKILEYSCWLVIINTISLTTFPPFDRKRYFEATNNCTQWFARHNLFDANLHTLVKRCGCFFVFVFCFFVVFFFIKEKRASPKHICIITYL